VNPLQQVKLEKVTLNIGTGEGGDRLQHAKTLLERISGRTAVLTHAHSRNPTFKIRKGEPIGAKVTLRGKAALDVIKRALDSRDGLMPPSCFRSGEAVSFGVKEYIDFPGIKYDPKIGMFGFDVCVTLFKAGKRVTRRKLHYSRIPARQRVSPGEAKEFFIKNFGATVEEKAAE